MHARARELDEAIREFREAYRIKPHYSVLYNLGQALSLAGKPVEATDTLTRYLHDGADAIAADRRASVEATLASLRRQVGELAFQVEPASAMLEVDGKSMDAAERAVPLRLSAGKHRWVARAGGHESSAGAVVVQGERRTEIEIRLAPSERAPLPPPAARKVESGAPAPPGQPGPATTFADHDGSKAPQAIYIVGAVGASFGIAAGVLGIITAGRYADWKRDRSALAEPQSAEDFREHQRQLTEDATSVRRLNTWTIGCATAGTALLAASATFWLLGRSESERRGLRLSVTGTAASAEWRAEW
ncbi:MAG TPA: hypothetical protein VFQ35_09850 [Polyangiaceae bacterium]|nr:hypothetical protein [Polyangiaceae bacterium]